MSSDEPGEPFTLESVWRTFRKIFSGREERGVKPLDHVPRNSMMPLAKGVEGVSSPSSTTGGLSPYMQQVRKIEMTESRESLGRFMRNTYKQVDPKKC